LAKLWKKGRGKLGPFVPFHGAWVAESSSDRGPVRCRRVLEPILSGHYLRLQARWEFGPPGSGRVYEEQAIIGVGDDGAVCFWSFTSDGKRHAKPESVTRFGPGNTMMGVTLFGG
jgi:hypothetical protein